MKLDRFAEIPNGLRRAGTLISSEDFLGSADSKEDSPPALLCQQTNCNSDCVEDSSQGRIIPTRRDDAGAVHNVEVVAIVHPAMGIEHGHFRQQVLNLRLNLCRTQQS